MPADPAIMEKGSMPTYNAVFTYPSIALRFNLKLHTVVADGDWEVIYVL